jgi:hypothetical protein
MGTLVYDGADAAGLDDRTLAHLQVIIVNKLRRQESFPFTWSDERRSMTIWLSPTTPIAFVYHGNRRPRLNRVWLEQLALMANSVGGLTIVPEPADDATTADEPEGLRADRTGTESRTAGS